MSSNPPTSDTGHVCVPEPQKFWTSKTFWAASIAEATLIYHMASTGHWDPDLIGASTMILLATVFRWTADQPLSIKG